VCDFTSSYLRLEAACEIFLKNYVGEIFVKYLRAEVEPPVPGSVPGTGSLEM
jgi:hypothetical protein